jgi:hypothetical protein
MEALTTAFQTAIGTMSTDILGMFQIALPSALGVMGAILAARLGIRFFRSIL